MRRKISNPVVSRTFEMLISSGIVYLVTPMLQKTLAPLQAQINASAVNAGKTPTEIGLSSVANQMVQLVPEPNPTPQTPVIVTDSGPKPIQAIVDTATDTFPFLK